MRIRLGGLISSRTSLTRPQSSLILHEKWRKRHMACVVLQEGAEATADELNDYLRYSPVVDTQGDASPQFPEVDA